jgi:hypothetical protein
MAMEQEDVNGDGNALRILAERYPPSLSKILTRADASAARLKRWAHRPAPTRPRQQYPFGRGDPAPGFPVTLMVLRTSVGGLIHAPCDD